MNLRTSFPSLTAALILLAAAAGFASTAEDEAPAEKAGPKVEVPFHGNERCPIMDKPAKANKFVEKNGERVHVCCSKCRRLLKADFDKQYAVAYPEEKIVDLKNERCPIMGEEIDGDDTMLFQGYRIRLCCPGCEEKFRADPRKHLTLLLNPELVALNNERCPMMREEPTERDNFFVYDGVLIDTCCSDCPEMFAEDPEKALKEAGIDLQKVKTASGK